MESLLFVSLSHFIYLFEDDGDPVWKLSLWSLFPLH